MPRSSNIRGVSILWIACKIVRKAKSLRDRQVEKPETVLSARCGRHGVRWLRAALGSVRCKAARSATVAARASVPVARKYNGVEGGSVETRCVSSREDACCGRKGVVLLRKKVVDNYPPAKQLLNALSDPGHLGTDIDCAFLHSVTRDWSPF